MTEPRVAVAARATLGEGPVWDDRAGILYWVDILGKSVHAFEPETGVDRVLDVGAHVGSLAMRTDGHLLVAAVDRLLDLDPADGALTEVVAVSHPGPAARFNDGKCDPAGRFWVGTMGYEQIPGSVRCGWRCGMVRPCTATPRTDGWTG